MLVFLKVSKRDARSLAWPCTSFHLHPLARPPAHLLTLTCLPVCRVGLRKSFYGPPQGLKPQIFGSPIHPKSPEPNENSASDSTWHTTKGLEHRWTIAGGSYPMANSTQHLDPDLSEHAHHTSMPGPTASLEHGEAGDLDAAHHRPLSPMYSLLLRSEF